MENQYINNPALQQPIPEQPIDNGALDWNSEVEEKEFQLLPIGSYTFQVVGFERGRYPGGAKMGPCPQATVTFAIDGGQDYGRRELKNNFYLHKSCQGFLFSFFRSIGCGGADGRVVMDWTKVMGAKGTCTVGTKTYNEKNYNEIKTFLAPQVPTGTPWGGTAAPATPNWSNGGF